MLNNEQINFYKENGYIGPIRVLDSVNSTTLSSKILYDLTLNPKNSSVYGVKTNRDIHLYSQGLMELIKNPIIVTCLSQLIGSNVMLWRSTVFYKSPASSNVYKSCSFGEIDWHQGIDFLKPSVDITDLHPAIGHSREENLKNMPLCITCWITLDDATKESGAMLFVPGSDRLGALGYVAAPSEEGFHGYPLVANYKGKLDESKAILVEAKKGECILFNNLVFHKSLPNRSNHKRLAVAFRYMSADIPVYKHGDPEGFNLDSWGCVQIVGKDESGVNKIIDVRTELM